MIVKDSPNNLFSKAVAVTTWKEMHILWHLRVAKVQSFQLLQLLITMYYVCSYYYVCTYVYTYYHTLLAMSTKWNPSTFYYTSLP
jgi:hypothetical protein